VKYKFKMRYCHLLSCSSQLFKTIFPSDSIQITQLTKSCVEQGSKLH
jgi:hypothetical protein